MSQPSFTIENIETGAVGMTLVPADAPAPDWTAALISQQPGWDRHEDLLLAQALPRWCPAQPTARWKACKKPSSKQPRWPKPTSTLFPPLRLPRPSKPAQPAKNVNH
jgi:hypothetical protein